MLDMTGATGVTDMVNTSFYPMLLGILVMSSLPIVIVSMTAFLKLSIVLLLVRNALGTQQVPSNMIIYVLSLILTIYVSAPLVSDIYGRLTAPDMSFKSAAGLQSVVTSVIDPLRASLERYAPIDERRFLLAAARRVWPRDFNVGATTDSMLIVIPAYISAEITRGFQIGFLLYLPFIAVDLIVSNILMAMGMAMVSPMVISTPFKILLFILVGGWTRLLHSLILSYAGH
jgi:type III secretion protein R